MPVLIEVLGLPGAGKSTIMGRLEHERFDLPEFHKPIDLGITALLRKLVHLACRLALRNPSTLLRLSARADGRWLLSKLAYRWAGLDKRVDGSLLLDSGLLQPLLSYAAEYSDGVVHIEDVIAVLSVLPLPKAIVYIDSGVETAYQRYCRRQQLTGRRAEVEVTLGGFLQAQEICDRIVAMFPPEQVIRVGEGGNIGDVELDEIATHLILWINSIESKKI